MMPNSGERYELAMPDAFTQDLGRAPKKVRRAFQKHVLSELRNHPDQPDPPKIKRLQRYRQLWRLRISNEYRLVYRRIEPNGGRGLITLLMLDHRREIYERLGSDTNGKPGIRIIATAPEDLFEPVPNTREIGEAVAAHALSRDKDPESPDSPLPVKLSPAILHSWGIAEQYHGTLGTAQTDGELLGLVEQVPGKVIERVMNSLWPPPIEKVVQEPVRLVDQPAEVLAAADGDRSLESFLLKLDDDQAAFVAQFDKDIPQGPWLLKGGPGSGKSVVALYCIRILIYRELGKLPGQRRQLKILLTTYTNALVNASRYLLDGLRAEDDGHSVVVATIDTVVSRYLPAEFQHLKSVSDQGAKPSARDAIEECRRSDDAFGFTSLDINYLINEVDWVIVGQDLRSMDEYLDVDRSGRKRGLAAQQRERVWAFYEAFVRSLRTKNLCLYSEKQRVALANARSSYDYVFVDEAQDLKPVGIRFAVALAESGTNVFITADSNQSIYGTGMSWVRVAQTLRFGGRRTQTLRRNYRTTKEIWGAVRQLSPDPQDAETIDVEPVFSGPWPVLVRIHKWSGWEERLNRFLFEAMKEERVGPDSVAVLCRSGRVMDAAMDVLSPTFNAKLMHSSELDIAHPGIKVTTMHAAKGLGFPIVAIVGVDEGVFPWTVSKGAESDDRLAREHRLLFVAGTRAMRQLMVMTNAKKPSRFLSEVTDEFWDIEDI